ncbi:conserved exported hypothetical protein [Desulfamplus magnetovallimortis]|uniref:Uncharacterized protein n=1 Tax=Desulfamplus magnetovallimortis TaxID=1246637 RepID=A0A1W1HIZ7_9BACT|nr:hypothetical protein [Desulfamplus magnetovallimortis]SLM32487.1 conserved exported hypothetical protein [Desulfamplus magnetovallimortis]
MKKIIGFIALAMIVLSSFAYAGGDQNHGGKGEGSTGSDGGGTTTQNRGQ